MMVKDFDEIIRRGGDAALKEASRFLTGTDAIYISLHNISARLDEMKIPYAVADAMAMVAYGCGCVTQAVEILLNAAGYDSAKRQLEGLGYVAPFKGSKNLRDVSTGVRIEFLISGQFPGDGKPKPIAFPDPSNTSVEIDGVHYLRLEKLIELKLASGMTNDARLRDLSDVQELIRVLKLGADFETKLDPYVRGKFAELRRAVEMDRRE